MKLALYMTATCPFCVMVTRAIDQLDLEVEMRNIAREPAFRQDLVAARGRQTVPVLRIQDGERDEWMPESRDIIRYLKTL